MAKSTLNEFVIAEITRVKNFANTWREFHAQKPETWQLEQDNEEVFVRQYLAFTGRIAKTKVEETKAVTQTVSYPKEDADMCDHPAAAVG